VRGPFLEQYTSVDNPLEIYGLPITGEFEGMSAYGITTVQYFNKAASTWSRALMARTKWWWPTSAS